MTIDAKARKLTAMQSGEGESVDFSYPVVADGNIEDWLLLLEQEMKRTMKDIVRKAARECFSMKLPEFIEKYPAQASLLGLQFIWTRDVQMALSKSKTEKGIIQSAWKRVGTILQELTAMAGKEVHLVIYFECIPILYCTALFNGTHKIGNSYNNPSASA